MHEVTFEEALDLLQAKDSRYHRDAYLFVREALDYTQKALKKNNHDEIRHVTGQELLEGIRQFALNQFGPMTMMIFEEWGIHACRDFGELVFNMVETGGASAFAIGDFKDLLSLSTKLTQHPDPLSQFLWGCLPDASRQLLLANTGTEVLEASLVASLNTIIRTESIYQENRFAGVRLSDQTKSLLNLGLAKQHLPWLNRSLLEDAYPLEIVKSHGLLAKTEKDSRADFESGYDFFEAFRKPFLPLSRQIKPETQFARSSQL